MPNQDKPYYIAGPMSHIPQFNFPAFIDAAETLRGKGWNIVSPVELDDPEFRAYALASPDGKPDLSGERSWGNCLGRDIALLADHCQGIILLPGWHRSKGARLETYVALQWDFDVYLYGNGNPCLMDSGDMLISTMVHTPVEILEEAA